jgi:hypothetical protein
VTNAIYLLDSLDGFDDFRPIVFGWSPAGIDQSESTCPVFLGIETGLFHGLSIHHGMRSDARVPVDALGAELAILAAFAEFAGNDAAKGYAVAVKMHPHLMGSVHEIVNCFAFDAEKLVQFLRGHFPAADDPPCQRKEIEFVHSSPQRLASGWGYDGGVPSRGVRGGQTTTAIMIPASSNATTQLSQTTFFPDSGPLDSSPCQNRF